MYRRIAVPVDGVEETEQAIAWAVMLARAAGGEIELVNVTFPVRHGGGPSTGDVAAESAADALVREGERFLRAEAARVQSDGIPVKTTVLQGVVPTVLAEYLEACSADLVVMTTRDVGRLERLLIGSISDTVASHVHKPILLLRPVKGATSPAPAIRRILVPLDGSEFGDEILGHAATLAGLTRAEMLLTTVIQPLLATAAAGIAEPGLTVAPPVTSIAADDESVKSELAWLEQAAAPLRQRGLTVATSVMVDGNPARAIVEHAKKHEADVIAMTTHGRGALQRLVAGSVSQKVLHSTPTAMLMHRPASLGA